MNRHARQILAIGLVGTMLLPVTGCKKKTAKKKTVSENDPYFNVTKSQLMLKVDSDKEIQYESIDNPIVCGSTIISPYTLNYRVPQEVEDEVEKIYMKDEITDEDWQYIQELLDEYSDTGIAFFNLDGEQISILDLEASETVQYMSADANGDILMIVQGLDDSYTSFDEMSWKMYLCKYSPEGELRMRSELDLPEDGWIEQFIPLEDGSILLSEYGQISKLSSDGKLIAQVEVEDGYATKIGDKIYLFTDEIKGDEYKAYLQELDTNTLKGIGNKEEYHLPYNSGNLSNSNGKTYTCDSNGIKIFTPTGSQYETFMDWDSTDVNYNQVMYNTFYVVSDDEIIFLQQTYDEQQSEDDTYIMKMEICHLTRADKNPHAGKTYIDLGSFDLYSEDFINYVVEYNTNPNNIARLRLHDYAADIDVYSSDYVKAQAGVSDKVYLELLAGTGPDILLNFSGYSQFNSDTVLVDLNQYIDGENGLNRDEYFDNVFRAFETNGKMYQIPVCVDIEGLLGNKTLIGERTGWTYSEFNQIVEGLPEEVSVFEDMEYETLLDHLLEHSMSKLIDYEKKEVYFDGDEFKQILQIAKKYGLAELPEYDDYYAIDDMYYTDVDGMYMPMPAPGGEEYVSPEDRMDEGLLALMESRVYSLSEYARKSDLCNGNAIYVGMPSPDGSGVSARPMMTCAIAASSPNKDEAWDFIKHLFDEEAQYKYTKSWYSIALNRKAFDRINDDEIEENQRMIQEFEAYKEGFGDDDIDMYDWWGITEITEEDRAGYQALVETISSISSTDMAVLGIIKEEAAAYFADQQSLDAVCNNIQNRTTNIVRER